MALEVYLDGKYAVASYTSKDSLATSNYVADDDNYKMATTPNLWISSISSEAPTVTGATVKL